VNAHSRPERIQTVVISGGQAGLSVGYYLERQGLPFVILDANQRIGDSWRKRWDSLRLFTPAKYDGLAGMPSSAPAHTFITKDEMADYLEAYAAHFKLPVRWGVNAERLSKHGDQFVVSAGDVCFEADNVVVAMANLQQPRRPAVTRLQQDRFLQSRVVCGTRRGNFAFVLGAPADQGIDRVDERRAERRQAILDRHGDGWVGGALDDAVALEVAQRDREHALADVGYRAADVHEAPGVAVQQVEDEQRPFVADAVEHVAGHPADGDPLLGYFFRTKCG
jgi:hypothetical protein